MNSKFKTIAILAMLFFYQGSIACDICGCGGGSNYLGVLPQYDINLIGVRMDYQSFNHPNTSLNYNGKSRVLKDSYYTSSIWFRYYPTKRMQFFGQIPYGTRVREETGQTSTIQGLGDIQLDLNYNLLDYSDSISKKYKHLLMLGGGLGLPTGMSQQRDETGLILPANFQLGVGAFTYRLNLMYTLRYKKWGLNVMGQNNWFQENELSYQFGNLFNSQFQIFYWTETEKLKIIPSLGLSYERSELDREYDIVDPFTSSEALFTNVSIDIYWEDFFLRTYTQIPLSQVVTYAQPESSVRLGMSLNYFFEKNRE